MQKIFIVLFALPFLAATCDKKPSNACLQGKVIRISCASFVVQVLSDVKIGEDGWKNTMDSTGATYNNVISVGNSCKMPAGLKAGDVIYFNADKPKPSDCVVCMMYDGPPKTQLDLMNVSNSPCGESR